jgi:hypothetical protein
MSETKEKIYLEIDNIQYYSSNVCVMFSYPDLNILEMLNCSTGWCYDFDFVSAGYDTIEDVMEEVNDGLYETVVEFFYNFEKKHNLEIENREDLQKNIVDKIEFDVRPRVEEAYDYMNNRDAEDE